MCTSDGSHFLAVEVKRHMKRNSVLIAQMICYREAVKLVNPSARVDGAAVAAGNLLLYLKDEDFRPYKPRATRSRHSRSPKIHKRKLNFKRRLTSERVAQHACQRRPSSVQLP